MMALLSQEQGVPAAILAELGADRESMRRRLHVLMDDMPWLQSSANQIFPTPRAENMLARAKAEADRLSDEFISSEHLLVALTQETEGQVSALLTEFGIDTEKGVPRPPEPCAAPTASPTNAPKVATARSTASP